MERSREARRPSMAASNGFLKLRERPNNKRSMREQSTKQRRVRGDQGHESTEEGSVGYSDEQAPHLMVAHEMIGVAVPRKARSASGKRSHEYASSGNYGGAGEEESLQQLSVKAASLSFSNVSARKKMKPNGPKIRPPKSSKSSEPVDEDIEIEIAEVLGLMKQSKSSNDQDNIKNSTLNLEAKDRNVAELKDKKVEAESALMAVQDSSVSEAGVFEKSDQPEKFETCSPKSNGELCNPVHHTGRDEGASGSIESQKDDAKPFMEEGKSILPKVEFISTGSKLESKREDMFKFDLMAPPPMEKEDLSDFASDPKPLPQDVEMKMEILVKNEEKVEKYVEEAVIEKVDEKKMETTHSSSVPLAMGSSTTLQPANSLLSQPRRKRCATHHYIAHNICLHQKVTKTNNFWPAETGYAPLRGTKPDIFKVILPAENIVIGNPMLGSLPGLNLQQSQEHEQGVSNFQGHSGNGKISEAANFTETLKRKHLAVQQAPASDGNEMHGHTITFPLGQHQVSGTSNSNQSGPLKHAKSTNNASLPSHSAARTLMSSSALPTVAAVNFINPNMAAKEGPYLALNGYPFPISTHIGTTPAFRGGNPAQPVPLFNGPFYSNQMFQPSQVQQQQPHSQLQHQNTNTSSDSTPSHKQQESQKLREAQFNSNNFLTSTSVQSQQSQKQYMPPSVQSCKLEGEMNGENTASLAVSHAQKSVYGQNFAVPFQPLNFTLMPYVTLGGGGGGSGNHIEESQHGMSFASFSGNNSTGSCLNFSTMAQNPAIFQSLPDMAQQGYKVGPAPQTAQKKNHQISERKTGGGSNNADDGLKAASGKSSSSIGQRQTLVFDNSARTLNFMSSPVTGSWPPRSIALTTTATNAPVDSKTSSNSQQHMFQFQLQKPHMLQQQQPAIAAKFPKNSPAFSQALVQCNSSAQAPQFSTVVSFPQQQGRSSQGQTQISFGGNHKSSLAPQRQQILTNKNQSSSSLVASSSMSTLQSHQTENSSPSGNGQMSSPACGRNLPSILSTCPSHISELKY
ncbi:time for coffee [Prunus dulcis]|uniref:Time for coffee n=1 Tax=Prunus dulcis TaxID=3755 RepID=A0A4Y1S2N8_PRUDU|nr:time for coffee [Prunus dulcis]